MEIQGIPGIEKIQQKLARVVNLDPTPMLQDWGKVIVEDNRAGLLAGIAGDGTPMKAVTYRTGQGKPTKSRSPKKGRFGTRVGAFKGFAPAGGGLLANNNLTTAQYRKLTGPPGVPRRDESRLIANLVLRDPYKQGHLWIIEAFWKDVVDPRGRPFLHHLFASGRDARGVRPAGLKKCLELAKAWAKYRLS